jgi:hypothetical protein
LGRDGVLNTYIIAPRVPLSYVPASVLPTAQSMKSHIDFALGEIQALIGKDLRKWDHDKAVELSDDQGAEVIAALWGDRM